MRVIAEANGGGDFSVLPGLRKTNGSSPPPGVNLDRIRSQDDPPDRDRSLFDFWAWHFKRCPDQGELAKLVFLAERDLETRVRTGLTTSDRHRARNRSILSSKYTDQPPAVVAAAEDCSEKHVRTWRQRNGLNAVTGRAERALTSA